MDAQSTKLMPPSEERESGVCFDGRYVPTGDRYILARLSPGQGVPVMRVPQCTQADMETGVAAAREAFED